MRTDRSDRMYEINNLMDAARTEFYKLLGFDSDLVVSPDRDQSRRDVLRLLNELRRIAETL